MTSTRTCSLYNMGACARPPCNLVIYARAQVASAELGDGLRFCTSMRTTWGILHQMELRKCMLERALAARGLSLRDDSRLCWMYIYENELIGRGDPSAALSRTSWT